MTKNRFGDDGKHELRERIAHGKLSIMRSGVVLTATLERAFQNDPFSVFVYSVPFVVQYS